RQVPLPEQGTSRRTPEAKWRLTSKRLAELGRMQAEILEKALPLVRAGGQLIYATCSVLKSENQEQVAGFLSRHDGVSCVTERVWPISGHGDGFYLSVMKV
ncbi:MAG: RsmB/NOP family class I SAM-dependent RNA methyltransferase, partial [Pseudomonadota bacterium]